MVALSRPVIGTFNDPSGEWAGPAGTAATAKDTATMWPPLPGKTLRD